MSTYFIDAETCIRCGVSMNQAPQLIELGEDAAVFARQPVNDEEIELAERALLFCPVGAIRKEA